MPVNPVIIRLKAEVVKDRAQWVRVHLWALVHSASEKVPQSLTESKTQCIKPEQDRHVVKFTKAEALFFFQTHNHTLFEKWNQLQPNNSQLLHWI